MKDQTRRTLETGLEELFLKQRINIGELLKYQHDLWAEIDSNTRMKGYCVLLINIVVVLLVR